MSDPTSLDIQIAALEAFIDSVETTPDTGLDRLLGKDDPESIQQSLNILLRADRIKEAANLVRDKEANVRWCENAILAFSRNAERDNAQLLLEWAAAQNIRTLKQRCSVALASGTLASVLDSRSVADPRNTFQLSDHQRSLLSEGLEAIKPMVDVAKANGAIETALEARALLVALEINHLLGDHAEFDRSAQLVIGGRDRKLPLDFAFAVLRYAISVPADFPERLRKDYPDSFEAGLAASMIEAQILRDSAKAFDSAYLLHDRPLTVDKQEQLFKFLAELAQTLGEEAIRSVDELATKLIAPTARFFKLYSATKHIREGRLDAALEIVEETHDEHDPEWLQIRAGLELAGGNSRTATDLTIRAAKLLPRPDLLARAGNMAYRDGRIEDAVQLLDQLLALNPRDIKSRNQLSFLLFEQKRFSEAACHLEILRTLDPDNFIHTLNEAMSLALTGKLEKSLNLFDSICSTTPSLPALLFRAQLLKVMNRPVDAFSSLQAVQENWWDDPQFLAAFMSTAYAAGKDESAHQAFLKIRSLQVEDKAPTYLLREVSLDDLKKEIQSYRQREELADQALLNGQLPWMLADRLLNRVAALGWAIRTQKLDFLAEQPSQRAEYSIYTTNGFAVRPDQEGSAKLEILEAPRGKTPIVADLSALITLNHIALLDKTAHYYGTIIIPADYCQTAIEEGSRLGDVQMSRVTSLKKIKRAVDDGLVMELVSTLTTDGSIAELREHVPDATTGKCYYRIKDIASILLARGEITDKELKEIHKVAHKPASAELGVKKLEVGDSILCDLSTVITLDACGCFEKLLQCFRLYLTAQEKENLLSSIRHLEFQETVRKSHAELWDHIGKDPRFILATYEVPNPSEQPREASDDLDQTLSSYLLAQQKGLPLLADDRASQALVLNEANGTAFGTEKVLDRLVQDDQLEREEAATMYLELMKRRYRFLVPTAEILKAFADRYEQHPPGRELREAARYLHDCMRDPGLLVGLEKTEPPTTVANHLFLEWANVITDLVMDCWSDESYSEERASRLTQWAMVEFLPSPPSALFWRAQRVLSSYLPNVVFARAMLKSIMMPTNKRANKALVSIANSLGIDQDTYTDLVIGAINVFRDSRARRR